MAESAQKQQQDDIIDLLVADHDKVRDMLSEMEDADGDRREELLQELYHEFMVHSDVEEEIVYPAYKAAVDDRDAKVDVLESIDEHNIARDTLEEMLDLGPTSIEFDAKLKLLKESIEHHADEEEEDMFPEFREAATEERLRELAKEVKGAKKELQDHYA